MTNNVRALLSGAPVVPLVQADDPDVAVGLSRALLDGGIQVLEVVLRTDKAFDCLHAIVTAFPDVAVGAGTVLSAEHASKAIDVGAKFIVSPGLHETVVRTAQDSGLPIFPGIATASELQKAWNMGLRAVKFFPASLSGGPDMLRALSSVFRDVVFMPTGGVNETNMISYLTIPSVIACGGSWLTPKAAIRSRDFKAIEQLARKAIYIANAQQRKV